MALPTVEAPKYRTTLFSTGDIVEYRPFLVKEEKVLLIALESKDVNQMVQAMYDIIDACTFNTLNVRKLPTYDMEHLFVQIRQKSVGEKQRVEVKCPECGTPNEFELNFDKVKLSSDPKEINDTIRISDNIAIKLKHPTLTEVYGVIKQDQTVAEQSINVAASAVDTIFYGEDVYDEANTTLEDIKQFIENLSSEQYKGIQEFVSKVPKIELDVAYTCQNCGHHEEETIRGLQSFFT